MQLATVKVTLLRSIFIAKVAMILSLLRMLLSVKKPSEKIVFVKAPPKEIHEHFYHPQVNSKEAEVNWLHHQIPWMK